MKIIYKITNLINNKSYVGFDSKNRLIEKYFGSGKLIQEAIEKFGIENFKKETLIGKDRFDKRSDKWWQEKETEMIKKYHTLFPDGYNLNENGWPLNFEACSKGAEITHQICRKNKTGFFDPKIQSVGGKISRKKAWEKNREAMMEVVRKGGKIATETNRRNKTGFFDSEVQSRAGKIGGKKSGKNCAYALFYVDGILQQMTLEQIEKL